MGAQHTHSISRPPTAHPLLPLLLLLFVGSGCAALIYEIVWFQLLQFIIGSSAVSLAVLLGTFMGGMCLGSLALPRLLSVRLHPLRVYAALELCIGGLGIAVLYGMPYVHQVYAAMVGHGLLGLLLRGVVCVICLLLPTVLMGATLPAIARWIETTPQGVSWLGFFYGGNIVGAVFGCLLAGFYFLREYDVVTATLVAASINAAVAILSLGFSMLAPHVAFRADPSQQPALPEPGAWTVYVTIALSGACALAAEVIWTRLLSLLLGGTVYTFSMILAVFLVGLGIGSSVGSLVARSARRPRVALGCCQLLLAAAVAWTAYALAESLPRWPIYRFYANDPWISFQLDLARCCWAILPATCLWGASFPLALAAVATRGQDSGRMVGGVYAANTIGAIVGAVVSSLILIAWLGTQNGQRVLIAVSVLSALCVLLPQLLPIRELASFSRLTGRTMLRVAGTVFLVCALCVITWFLCRTVKAVPWELVAFGRTILEPQVEAPYELEYLGEGMTSSVAVTRRHDGHLSFHVSGKIEASSDPVDMRLQRMLGHLPALVLPEPRSVLIVGCGAGVTAGTFVVYPSIERIVICEIEPLVPQVVATYFKKENEDVVNDPRVEIVIDDARHFILTTNEKFDIITSDPIHPWVKGSATLYSAEYFELCKQHLKPGGAITQWVPLYESSPEVVQSEIATFFEVFPNGTLWKNQDGYDTVIFGQVEPTRIDVDEIQQRLTRKPYEKVNRSLKDVSFHYADQLFATYIGQKADLLPWLANAQINRDRNLRLQYLAGLQLNSQKGTEIYLEVMKYWKFPAEIFVGKGPCNEELRKAFNSSDFEPGF